MRCVDRSTERSKTFSRRNANSASRSCSPTSRHQQRRKPFDPLDQRLPWVFNRSARSKGESTAKMLTFGDLSESMARDRGLSRHRGPEPGADYARLSVKMSRKRRRATGGIDVDRANAGNEAEVFQDDDLGDCDQPVPVLFRPKAGELSRR